MQSWDFPVDLSLSDFLTDYWQKKPCLIRQAIPDFYSAITPDELAALSCEHDTSSRIITKLPDKKWNVEYGPFDDEIYSKLPDSHWTLLVSDLDKRIPDIKNLLNLFRFIPDWRIDDIMVSYATNHGTVGPHVDMYDVFLLQAKGQRQWMISENFDSTSLPDTELSILKNFTTETEWILDPGDILYLPPNIAHYGVAIDDCMTYSIGSRSPSAKAISEEYVAYCADKINDNIMYSDVNLKSQQHSAEITKETITKIKHLLEDNIKFSEDTIKKWFGKYISDINVLKNDQPEGLNLTNTEELNYFLAKSTILKHSIKTKFLFIRNNDHTLLYVNGEEYSVNTELAELLCTNQDINTKEITEVLQSNDDSNTLLSLINTGYLIT